MPQDFLCLDTLIYIPCEGRSGESFRPWDAKTVRISITCVLIPYLSCGFLPTNRLPLYDVQSPRTESRGPYPSENTICRPNRVTDGTLAHVTFREYCLGIPDLLTNDSLPKKNHVCEGRLDQKRTLFSSQPPSTQLLRLSIPT